MPPARMHPETTALLIVDLQEKLLPVIDGGDAVVSQAGRLLDGAAALDMPVLATEQYPKGLGRTVDPIAPKLERAQCMAEKVKFSAFVDPVRDGLGGLGARQVVVAGIEAHVCVLQTCLDLLDAGYTPAVAVDAIGSRRGADRDAAVQRMTQAGVVPTTVESLLLEWVGQAGGERFKAVLPVVKR